MHSGTIDHWHRISVRILVNGAHDFRLTTDTAQKGIRQTIKIAVKMAKTSIKRVLPPVGLATI